MSKEQFVSSIIEAFSCAKAIVHQRQSTTAEQFLSRIESLSRSLSSLEDCNQYWKAWPVSPTTFGQYQHAGTSALDVAFRFARTVHSASQAAKVFSIGMPSRSEITKHKASRWMRAMKKELENVTLDLSNWGPAAMMRDAELVVLKIQSEYANVRDDKTIVETKIEMVAGGIRIQNDVFPLNANAIDLLTVLVNAKGEFVSITKECFRSRDVKNLPINVRNLLESIPGAGTRIRKEWLS